MVVAWLSIVRAWVAMMAESAAQEGQEEIGEGEREIDGAGTGVGGGVSSRPNSQSIVTPHRSAITERLSGLGNRPSS